MTVRAPAMTATPSMKKAGPKAGSFVINRA
jgi:hypothetical protein